MPGRVTLSIEVELGWGYHDLGDTDPFSEGRVAETERLDALLSLCDHLEIPFTFDVVGALMLDRWPDGLDSPHADGWFDTIPKTGVDSDPLFYAPDMIRSIDEAAVDHEIGTHTFSHALFDQISPEVAAWELDQARIAHEAFGLDAPVSLVPPRHHRPPSDVLRDRGIEILRLPGYPSAPTKIHKFNELLFDPQPPTPPRIVDDVVETYCTIYTSLTSSSLPFGQLPVHPAFRPLPRSVGKRLHERYLDRAVEQAVRKDSHTHLWCHLYDMANGEQWDPISSFLERLAKRRDRGEVEILPMVALNEEVRSSVDTTSNAGRQTLAADGGPPSGGPPAGGPPFEGESR